MTRLPALAVLPLFLLPSAGCNFELPDEITGLTNRFVVQGIYMGVETPEDDNIAAALDGTDFGGGAQVTAFFADAASIDEIEEAPISGLSPTFRSPAEGSFTLVEDDDGRYSLDAGAGLAYTGGESVVISVDFEGVTHKVPADAPSGPELSLSQTHTAGQPMVINLDGQGFDTTVITVIDVSTGDMTWDNLPSDISDVLDLGGDEDEGGAIEIPGTAFATESIYAVGVGGLVGADTLQFEEVNTLLSGFKAGTMAFQPVCTFSESVLCDQ